MKPDIAELLRTMPDLEPPANAWQRIAREQARRNLLQRSGGMAVAASVLIAIAVGVLYVQRSATVTSLVRPSSVQPMIVSAPAGQSRHRAAGRAVDPEVQALQQRSQYMERLISEMPRRGRIVVADTAGVIAELEDRIAAVDYQLNRIGLNRAGLNRTESFRPGFEQREPQAGGDGYYPPEEQTDAPGLWRRRVGYMDQLVRARYMEAGATGY